MYHIRDRDQHYEPTRAELLELARQYDEESDEDDGSWIGSSFSVLHIYINIS